VSSSKCPNCGLTNFSSALVCRRCGCPLIGDVANKIRESRPVQKQSSYRWLVLASMFSLAFAFLLFLMFFLFTVIPNAMSTSETGWRDYTAEQKANMSFWYFLSLGCGIAIILLFFYSRRRKYALGA